MLSDLENKTPAKLSAALTQWRTGIVDLAPQPPAEFDPLDAATIMAREFNGKSPSPSGQKVVRVNGGPPGSGKTFSQTPLRETFRNAVYYNPDEGFLVYMKRYIDGITRDISPQNRLAVYNQQRGASQYGSGLILNRAAAEGYDIIFDTTLQSPLSLDMLDKLKTEHGYRIEADSVCAPLEVCLERNGKRARIIPEADLLAKRPNFYRQLPQIVAHTDRFSLSWNPVDGQPSKKAFEFEAGRLVYADATIIAEIANDIAGEVPSTAAWLNKLKPAVIGSPSPLP